MRTLSRPLAVVAALALVAASAAAAQRPQTRQGFWIGFGFGYGSAGLSCDGCGSIDREGAVSGYLKLGGTLSPKVLLGGETNGWTKDIGGSTVTLGNASLAAYFYPQPAGGLYLRGGVGVASYAEEGIDSQTGFGLTFGVGYDVRVGNNVSITPVGNFNWGSVGDLDAEVRGLKQNVFQLAVGVTFH
ncbi:MAG: outer membrane beta-barrel protein [Gemmatimonadales bacterium]